MDDQFPHVFSPFRLGGFNLRNRLVALPAGTSMVERGVPTHGDIDHFERLAAGGVGLVIGGATVVHPTSTLRSAARRGLPRRGRPRDRGQGRGLHRHGARFIGQLCHLGREFIGGESDHRRSRRPPSRPSAMPTRRTSSRSLRSTTSWRAGRCRRPTRQGSARRRGGARGPRILARAVHVAPTNLRSDAFGGSFNNRLRFMRLVLEAMRSVAPDGFVLGVRLSGEEEIPGGMDTDDCVRIAEDLAGLGGVDYFSITHGTRGEYVKDSTHDAVAVPSASRVRAATGLPPWSVSGSATSQRPSTR